MIRCLAPRDIDGFKPSIEFEGKTIRLVRCPEQQQDANEAKYCVISKRYWFIAVDIATILNLSSSQRFSILSKFREPEEKLLCHIFNIPRGVTVLTIRGLCRLLCGTDFGTIEQRIVAKTLFDQLSIHLY